jgi:hypothetical protein
MFIFSVHTIFLKIALLLHNKIRVNSKTVNIYSYTHNITYLIINFKENACQSQQTKLL